MRQKQDRAPCQNFTTLLALHAKASWKVLSAQTSSNRTGIPFTNNCGKPMPGCDSPRCRSSCGARAQRPPCPIDSLKSAHPTTIPLADYRCCGARLNRRSIALGKIDTTMGATRVSISACQPLSHPHPALKNRRQLLQPNGLTGISPSQNRMLKKARLLTRPTLARRDAPCPKQGCSERRGEAYASVR